jgi:L-ascorbate metabolism protein UlaG (beta-lactamase superfamily)
MINYITWYGHAAMKFSGEKIVYIDPFEMEQGPYDPADIILITHDHYDHCSLGDITKLSKENTVIIAPQNCKSKLKGHVKIIAAGESILEQGVQIEAVPAYNIGKTFHQKSAGGLGYIVTLNGKRIYQAGDTDFIPEMKQIKADVVILPVGGTYTMTAEEAAKAANAIQPEVAIPMHYGSIVGSVTDAETFKRLTNVPVEILTPAKG